MAETGVNRPTGPVHRGRARALRRRAGLGGQHSGVSAAPGGGGQLPSGADPSQRWRRGRPAYYGVEWPFWLLMLTPWLAWGLLLLLSHLGICLICMPR